MTATTGCRQCGRPIEAGAQFCANCGANVSDAQGSLATAMMAPPSATQQMQDILLERLRDACLGEYEVLTELGRGGMATVYLAHDLQLDRKVAIKVMLPSLLEGEGMVERFKLEARTAAQLSHPHIIPIYAVRDIEGLLFFVMKFVEGRPLDSIMDEVGQLPIVMAQSILTKVGEALGYAHRRGVVHRDIKPANIMVDVEGMPVVTDFGIAKVSDSSRLTMTGATVGTPTYMSPEQCAAGVITGASDQYSLGVVAYQMLSGHTPFPGDSIVGLLYKHVHEPPPPFQDARTDLPPALHEAVMKMLGKKPEDRFPSLDAAVQAIGSVTLAFDHPVRSQLIDLAKRGGNANIMARVSTPRSPTPVRSQKLPQRGAAGGATRRLAGQQATSAAAPTVVTGTPAAASGRSRALAWVAGVVLVAAIGLAVWTRPWERGAPAAASQAPPPAPDVANLTVQPASGVLDVGGSLQLAAAARDSVGQAVTAAVTWTSDAPAVASVSSGGLVQALAPGEAHIRAEVGTVQSEAVVSVAAAAPAPAPTTPGTPPATVAQIRVDGAPSSLAVGGAALLRAVALDRRNAPVAGDPVTWESSDNARASVTPQGLVTARAPGTVVITARSGSVTRTVPIEIAAPQPASVSVSSAPGPLSVGSSTRLTATVLAEDGRPLSVPLTWRTSDARVATVSDGVVSAVGGGTATITASAGARDGSTVVRVTAPEPAPAPAPANNPPPAAVDPRDAIAALIQQYARALESKQLSEVRRVYPGIPSDQANQVDQTLRSLEQLRVQLRIDNLDLAGDNDATARVSGEYQFYSRENRRTEHLPVNLQMTLEKSGNTWRIRSIR